MRGRRRDVNGRLGRGGLDVAFDETEATRSQGSDGPLEIGHEARLHAVEHTHPARVGDSHLQLFAGKSLDAGAPSDVRSHDPRPDAAEEDHPRRGVAIEHTTEQRSAAEGLQGPIPETPRRPSERPAATGGSRLRSVVRRVRRSGHA